MDAAKFLQKYAKTINNHVTLGPIDKQQCCLECFQKGEVVPIRFDQKRNGWVCDKNHFALNEGLPSSKVVRSPIP